MNELELSTDLNVITAEINSYKQVAGQSIFEIGKRLKHVKENDLVHGEWTQWCEGIGLSRNQATKFIKVFDEFGSNDSTWNHLGLSALYQIATMPEGERTNEHTIPSTGETKPVDEMTARELEEVKRALKQKETELEQTKADLEQAETWNSFHESKIKMIENRKPETIEVIKEVVPEDVQKQLQKKDHMLDLLKSNMDAMDEELKLLRAKDTDDPGDEFADKKMKRLEREASIEILELSVHIQNFLKGASLSAYKLGALASASESAKKKTKESIDLLDHFSSNVKSALNGRIQI